MKTELIAALAGMLLSSSSAWAHEDWPRERSDWDANWSNGANMGRQDSWHHRHHRHRDDGNDRYNNRHGSRYGTTAFVYPAPNPYVVYEAPRVIYRDRIVYRNVPVYAEMPRSYPQDETWPSHDNDYPVLGTAIGAIAGGAIGSQLGKGNGRTASTAIGAVIGGALGAEYLGR